MRKAEARKCPPSANALEITCCNLKHNLKCNAIGALQGEVQTAYKNNNLEN